MSAIDTGRLSLRPVQRADHAVLHALFTLPGVRHLNKGYGREIAQAVVGYGFHVLHMPAIRASTDAAHTVSRRLLEDVGFTLERQATVAGLDTVFYTKPSC